MKAKVNGKYFLYFNEVIISTTLDTIASTFSFFAFYDATIPGHNELFRPLSYAKIEFFDDNDRLLSTGTIVHWNFKSDSGPSLVQLSGYSLPGVLEDCQIPYRLYPLESNNRTLAQIAARLISPFNFNNIVYDSVKNEANQTIAKTIAKIDESIKDYLCKVANQKNVVLSHDIHGNLIMFRPDIHSAPKLSLNDQNTVSMELDVDGTKIHSDITTIRQPSRGDNPANQFENENDLNNISNPDAPKGKVFKIESISTVKNPLVKAYRPYVDRLTKLSFYDTQRAALNMRAAELKNIRVNFELDHWPVVSVGDIIEVYNPELFIVNKVKMVLETTIIQESSKSKTMKGTLVLLETFTGDEPQNIFG